jgi:hypothetical protein
MEFEIKNNQDFPEFYIVRGNRLTSEEYSRLLMLRSLVSAYNKPYTPIRKLNNRYPREMRLHNTAGTVLRVGKLLSCSNGHVYCMLKGKKIVTHKNLKKIIDELIRIS